MAHLLQLIPEFHQRVWGGQRLKPSDPPVGEAWIVHEHNHVASGPHAGKTLAEVTRELGSALLGQSVVARTGSRFPLLIKLLDCNDWLSIQVHPNDEQAAELEGEGLFGKTEAWHVLDAVSDAKLIAGVKPGTSAETLAQSIRAGTVLDYAEMQPVRVGDTVFMPAGTLHALGPGLLIYEVQQASDITYRVWDWDRPASAGRKLHIAQSLAVTDHTASGEVTPLRPMLDTDAQQLVECDYFTLDLLASHDETLALDTGRKSFHALTVIEGQAAVEAGGESMTLGKYETVVVAANAGGYTVQPLAPFRMLKSSV